MFVSIQRQLRRILSKMYVYQDDNAMAIRQALAHLIVQIDNAETSSEQQKEIDCDIESKKDTKNTNNNDTNNNDDDIPSLVSVSDDDDDDWVDDIDDDIPLKDNRCVVEKVDYIVTKNLTVDANVFEEEPKKYTQDTQDTQKYTQDITVSPWKPKDMLLYYMVLYSGNEEEVQKIAVEAFEKEYKWEVLYTAIEQNDENLINKLMRCLYVSWNEALYCNNNKYKQDMYNHIQSSSVLLQIAYQFAYHGHIQTYLSNFDGISNTYPNHVLQQILYGALCGCFDKENFKDVKYILQYGIDEKSGRRFCLDCNHKGRETNKEMMRQIMNVCTTRYTQKNGHIPIICDFC